MITKVKGGFEEPPKMWWYRPEVVNTEEMADENQRRTLTELIYQNILDEDGQEEYLSQLNDLTSAEAADMIFEFRMARW